MLEEAEAAVVEKLYKKEQKRLDELTENTEKMVADGYLPDERWHIWTIDSISGKAKQLTDHEIFDDKDPAWSPDSKSIAFMSNHSSDPDLDPDAVDLFLIPSAGGKHKRINTSFGDKSKPSF